MGNPPTIWIWYFDGVQKNGILGQRLVVAFVGDSVLVIFLAWTCCDPFFGLSVADMSSLFNLGSSLWYHKIPCATFAWLLLILGPIVVKQQDSTTKTDGHGQDMKWPGLRSALIG